ncbi:MAG: ribonuclease Z [Candidatus Woesearchaeota archaeon]
MKITFLGTSGMVPTKERNVQGIHIEHKGEGILLDCGEGTQRQLSIANINAQKITTILISHWHGDHVSGLIGLIQTLGNFSGGEKKIKLFGPEGTKAHLNNLLNSCLFETNIEIEVKEVNASRLTTIHETDTYSIEAIDLEHSVPCLGYRFTRKDYRKMDNEALSRYGIKPGPLVGRLQEGRKVTVNGTTITPEMVSTTIPAEHVAFILDTKLTRGCYDLAENARLLVSEAVYTHELENKAIEYKHMTARQAAQVASEAGVQELILTHFSQRYKDLQPFVDDAKELFERVSCAYDFMTLKLKL